MCTQYTKSYGEYSKNKIVLNPEQCSGFFKCINVKIGTHDELIKNECGAYKMLYDMQFKTKEPIK